MEIRSWWTSKNDDKREIGKKNGTKEKAELVPVPRKPIIIDLNEGGSDISWAPVPTLQPRGWHYSQKRGGDSKKLLN